MAVRCRYDRRRVVRSYASARQDFDFPRGAVVQAGQQLQCIGIVDTPGAARRQNPRKAQVKQPFEGLQRIRREVEGAVKYRRAAGAALDQHATMRLVNSTLPVERADNNAVHAQRHRRGRFVGDAGDVLGRVSKVTRERNVQTCIGNPAGRVWPNEDHQRHVSGRAHGGERLRIGCEPAGGQVAR